MTARGYADDRKVSVTGDTMTGTLHFDGVPPFTVAAGLAGGTAVLNGTSAVAVSTVLAGAASLVFLSVMPGGAPAGIPWVTSVTPGSGFTIASTSAGDTAVTVAWYVLQPA